VATIIFVHGTGVREPSASETYEKVRENLQALALGLNVKRTNWGGQLGTRLFGGGVSVPNYDTARSLLGPVAQSVPDDSPPEEFLPVLWDLLTQDPLYELRLLALKTEASAGAELPPNAITAGEKLLNVAANLSMNTVSAGHAPAIQRLRETLNQAGIAAVLEPARDAILEQQITRDAISQSNEPTDIYPALSRAIAAEAMLRTVLEEPTVEIWMAESLRDEVARKLEAVLRNEVSDRAIIPNWIKKQLAGLGKSLLTSAIRRKRGLITDKLYGFPADILLYQARGGTIRDSLRKLVDEAPDDVILLGHSLGGIACVDLLVEQPLPKVKMLITVGSQAPFLYELNCLVSMSYDADAARDERLPIHFPTHWLNFYDQRDILSYVGAKLFGNRIMDIEMQNGQPFPDSHSAYWDNNALYAKIKAKIEEMRQKEGSLQ
jgi:hypothetical protein